MSRYCRHGSIADMCGHAECNPPVSKTNRVVLAAEPLHEAMVHAGLIPVPVQPTDPQVEKVARALSRAYIAGFRHANTSVTDWITTVDEAVAIQWTMFQQEAQEALLP